MNAAIETLTEKEKQALRLLVSGHDAKSMARQLGLSVHTINERLRDARRKLATSSSREAARVLREAECHTPHLLGDKGFGGAAEAGATQPCEQPVEDRGNRRRIGWMIGGLAMSLAMAIFAATAMMGGGAGPADTARDAPVAVDPAQQGAEQAARRFLELVDAKDWRASYAATGSKFREANTLERWTASAQGAHGALGPALKRDLITADFSPAPPNGVYNVRFLSHFAGGRKTVETLALSYEDGAWRVVGLMLD